MGKKNNTSATQQVAEVNKEEETVQSIQEQTIETDVEKSDEQDNQIINSPEILEQKVNDPEILKQEKNKIPGEESEELENQIINSPDILEKKVNDPEVLKFETPVNETDLSFELDGEKYTFTDDCPTKLQIENKLYSVKDLVTNEEILNSLVVGESAFVKKL